jgi:predicted nucleic acid-binding protein
MKQKGFFDENDRLNELSKLGDPLVAMAHEIENSGQKIFDALHIACAITAQCDYLITVDNGMLKYTDKRIKICDPIEFISKETKYD